MTKLKSTDQMVLEHQLSTLAGLTPDQIESVTDILDVQQYRTRAEVFDMLSTANTLINSHEDSIRVWEANYASVCGQLSSAKESVNMWRDRYSTVADELSDTSREVKELLLQIKNLETEQLADGLSAEDWLGLCRSMEDMAVSYGLAAIFAPDPGVVIAPIRPKIPLDCFRKNSSLFEKVFGKV